MGADVPRLATTSPFRSVANLDVGTPALLFHTRSASDDLLEELENVSTLQDTFDQLGQGCVSSAPTSPRAGDAIPQEGNVRAGTRRKSLHRRMSMSRQQLVRSKSKADGGLLEIPGGSNNNSGRTSTTSSSVPSVRPLSDRSAIPDAATSTSSYNVKGGLDQLLPSSARSHPSSSSLHQQNHLTTHPQLHEENTFTYPSSSPSKSPRSEGGGVSRSLRKSPRKQPLSSRSVEARRVLLDEFNSPMPVSRVFNRFGRCSQYPSRSRPPLSG